MHRSSPPNAIFCIALLALVLSSTISTQAVSQAYLPAVMQGQFAQYKALKYSCQSSFPQLCQSFEASLNETIYDAVQIGGVSGSSVSLQRTSIYKNGTGAHTGGLVNVETGSSNITAFSLGKSDYFLLAGGLAAPNPIWNTVVAPILNKTTSEMIVGSMRNVNLLNYTLPGSYLGVGYLQSFNFTFDQSSGFLIEINSYLRTNTAGVLELGFGIGMVDNNVWGNAHIPDFDLSANPRSVNIATSASGSSTITLHRLYGFSATVRLSATSSASGISCSFATNTLSMGGSDTSTISCRGSPGIYIVTVEGDGGYSVHNASIPFTVRSVPTTTQPASNLSTPLIYGGIGLAAIIVALAALLFFRRKPSRTIVVSGDASTPAVQP